MTRPDTPSAARAGAPPAAAPRPATGRMGVTIVVPARNEAPTLGMIIQKCLPHCDELVVVDGHSTDETPEIVRKYGVRRVLDNGKGKGDAVRVGAAAATQDIVVFIDADGSHDPDDIPRLVDPIRQGAADLVIGSRGKGGSDELHGDIGKLIRLVGSDLILIGINWRWQSTLTDSQNGFRAIRREVILQLGLRENITTIEQEMTMKALRKGFVVDEIPAHEYARITGESTIKLEKVWLRYVYAFLRDLLF